MPIKNKEKQLAVFGDFSGYLEETAFLICLSPPEPRLIFRKSEGIKA